MNRFVSSRTYYRIMLAVASAWAVASYLLGPTVDHWIEPETPDPRFTFFLFVVGAYFLMRLAGRFITHPPSPWSPTIYDDPNVS